MQVCHSTCKQEYSFYIVLMSVGHEHLKINLTYTAILNAFKS